MDSVAKSVTMDELFAGTYPVKKRGVTIAAGADLVRGSLIGVITASDKGALVSDASNDGSEVAEGILLDDVAAASEDKAGTIALTGDFNQLALTVGGSTAVADYAAALRNKSIFIDQSAQPVV